MRIIDIRAGRPWLSRGDFYPPLKSRLRFRFLLIAKAPMHIAASEIDSQITTANARTVPQSRNAKRIPTAAIMIPAGRKITSSSLILGLITGEVTLMIPPLQCK